MLCIWTTSPPPSYKYSQWTPGQWLEYTSYLLFKTSTTLKTFSTQKQKFSNWPWIENVTKLLGRIYIIHILTLNAGRTSSYMFSGEITLKNVSEWMIGGTLAAHFLFQLLFDYSCYTSRAKSNIRKVIHKFHSCLSSSFAY